MRIVNGKQDRELDARQMAAWRERYQETIVDLGAGDGRFVRALAQRNPRLGAIGVDLCAANLRAASRAAGQNALIVVADALALPAELHGMATRVTINFPWGSLLRGLLTGHAGLLAGLHALSNGETHLEILLNAGALAEEGWTLETGGDQVMTALINAGFRIGATSLLGPPELRHWPTTWAKRLAFGRDPRAIRLSAISQSASLSDIQHSTRDTQHLPITHHPSPPFCYTSRLAGAEPAC
jgi:16S rRNA (adenine(1408)-N(1))-methyltransferase